MLDEEVHVFLGGVDRQSVRCGFQVAEATLFRLGDPGVIISVAVENDPLMVGKDLFDELFQIRLEILGLFQLVGKLLQFLRHDGVQSNVGTGDRLAGAKHPELKLIAGEGHGRGAVPVRVVLGNGRHGVHADLEGAFAGLLELRTADDGLHDGIQFVTQEDGEDCGRCFGSAQTVIVAGKCHRSPQEVLILVHALDKGRQEQQELGVLAGSLAGLEEVLACVGVQGPVIVLAGAVDTGEGLFIQKAHQIVLFCDLFHDLHGELVVVAGGVGVGIDGSHLVLGGGRFVVLGLAVNTQSPEVFVQVLHEGCYPGTDGAVIVVIQLLTAGRLGTEEGAAGHPQVLPLVVHLLIHQEVLLLRAYAGDDPAALSVSEQPEDPDGLTAHVLHGPQQRRLFVQRVTAVGAQDGGDAEGALLDKGKGGGVPSGVAAGLKGGPQAAGGEGGGIRLAPNQVLAGKFQDHPAALGRGDEAVVLFRREASHRLEPVGIVGAAPLHRPGLHGPGNLIGGSQFQRCSIGDATLPRLIAGAGQPLLHGFLIEYSAAEQFGQFQLAHGGPSVQDDKISSLSYHKFM